MGKTKTALRMIAIATFSALIAYIIISFVTQEYHYKKWHWSLRLVELLMAGSLSVLLSVVFIKTPKQ